MILFWLSRQTTGCRSYGGEPERTTSPLSEDEDSAPCGFVAQVDSIEIDPRSQRFPPLVQTVESQAVGPRRKIGFIEQVPDTAPPRIEQRHPRMAAERSGEREQTHRRPGGRGHTGAQDPAGLRR